MDIENLKKIPWFPRSFEGFPEYEERLARRCAYIGKPCSRCECNKWMEVIIEAPNPLHPATREQVTLHQCQDDQMIAMLLNLTTTLGGFVQQVAAAAQQQVPGIPRKGNLNLDDILRGKG